MFFKALFGATTGSLVRGKSLPAEGWGALEADSKLQTDEVDGWEGSEQRLHWEWVLDF